MSVSRRTIIAGAAGLAAAGEASANARRSVRFEIDRFIEDVKQAQREHDAQRAVEAVLARAVSEPGQMLASLGEPTEVGLREIHRAPDLTILNVVWSPYMVLLPHEHKMWATIGIYAGREDNIFWDRDGQIIRAGRATSLGEREVLSLPVDAVHSVTNPLRRLTCAIHIYGGDFFAARRSEWNPETLRERPIDLEGIQQLFREANERFRASRP
jgi:predicted metal-dependent enzyme (double-stranded beta helix superfamily)